MTMLRKVILFLLAAVSGLCCLKIDESDDSLVSLIENCEWTTKQNVVSEILLERYREYVLYNFFLMNDVCAVYEWNKFLKDSEYSENNTVVEKNPSNAQGNQEQVSGDDHPALTVFDHPINATCTRSAKDFFICISNLLVDQTLNAMILNSLEFACDSTGTDQKRNSKYVSKQKFFSWGGKRNFEQGFYRWGGKRSAEQRFYPWGGKRDVEQRFYPLGSKRSAEQGFYPWGEKRSAEQEFYPWGDKRSAEQRFYPWGGKRNAEQEFYPWGGKRSTSRVQRQPKIVIRNPFHAWGGKRNHIDENESKMYA